MNPINSTRDLKDEEIAIISGETVTVTSEAQNLNIGESKHSDPILYSEGNLEFTYNTGSDTYTVSSIGECVANSIVIPNEYNGKKVIRIANNAFRDNTQITSIKIASSIQNIGDYAFQNCSYLESVVFEENESNLHIGRYAFSNSDIREIHIPSFVTKIEYGAFENCNNLESVVFDENTDIILSMDLFKGCTSLETVTLPYGLKTIPTACFWGCSYILEITIPDTVKYIGDNAFRDCTRLIRVTFSGDPKIKRIESRAFDNSGLRNIRIPSSVREIATRAFYNSSLSNVIFENPYGWFIGDSNVRLVIDDIEGDYFECDNPENLQLIDAAVISTDPNYSQQAAKYLRYNDVDSAWGQEQGYAHKSWHRFDKMLAPTISISGSTLHMTDPLGVAEVFHIYVGGERRATVYPSSSGSAAAEPAAASLDEGEGETIVEELETPIEDPEITSGEVEPVAASLDEGEGETIVEELETPIEDPETTGGEVEV